MKNISIKLFVNILYRLCMVYILTKSEKFGQAADEAANLKSLENSN